MIKVSCRLSALGKTTLANCHSDNLGQPLVLVGPIGLQSLRMGHHQPLPRSVCPENIMCQND
jgi:hypothetical protein